MASPNSNFGVIATTTLNNYAKTMADNVTNNNGITRELKKRGRMRLLDGGDFIVRGVSYAENPNFQWYSGYQTLSIGPSDEMTSASFAWAQGAVSVVISGREMRQNAGSNRIFNLLKEKKDVAESTAQNQFATAAYSDGTGSGGLQPAGLQLLVDDTPATGTVGGINAATYSWWRNQKLTVAAFTSTTITGYMNRLYRNLVRGQDVPQFIVTDNNGYNAYLGSLQAIQRLTDANGTGEAGFPKLAYNGMPVIFDGGIGGACPATHMYFLNPNYLSLDVHDQANWEWEKEIRSINQDAFVNTCIWMGQFTCSGRKFQGVLSPA